MEALLKCLEKYGFHQDYFKENLIAVAYYRASVMLGKKSGVACVLQMMFPDIIWHTVQITIWVGDTLKEVSGINHFMDKLYSLYHQSLKKQRELKEVAASLETEILKIRNALSTHWVASSKHTVEAVLRNFSALVDHFSKASQDPTRDSVERNKYDGLLQIIKTEGFILNLNALSEASEELADLSDILQRS